MIREIHTVQKTLPFIFLFLLILFHLILETTNSRKRHCKVNIKNIVNHLIIIFSYLPVITFIANK